MPNGKDFFFFLFRPLKMLLPKSKPQTTEASMIDMIKTKKLNMSLF